MRRFGTRSHRHWPVRAGVRRDRGTAVPRENFRGLLRAADRRAIRRASAFFLVAGHLWGGAPGGVPPVGGPASPGTNVGRVWGTERGRRDVKVASLLTGGCMRWWECRWPHQSTEMALSEGSATSKMDQSCSQGVFETAPLSAPESATTRGRVAMATLEQLAQSERPRVLVIDGNLLTAEAIVLALGQLAFTSRFVVPVTTEHLRDVVITWRPRLALLDIDSVAHSTSLECVDIMQGAGIPVAVMGGKADDQLLGRCIHAGASSVVDKNSPLVDLGSVIVRHLAGEVVLREDVRQRLTEPYHREIRDRRARLAPFEVLTPAKSACSGSSWRAMQLRRSPDVPRYPSRRCVHRSRRFCRSSGSTPSWQRPPWLARPAGRRSTPGVSAPTSALLNLISSPNWYRAASSRRAFRHRAIARTAHRPRSMR